MAFKSLVILLLLFVASQATDPLRNDICEDDYWLIDSNPFDNLQSSCQQAYDQLETRWCSQTPACVGSSFAMAAATAPVQTVGAVTTFLQQFPGLGFAFDSTGFVLATTGGGPNISRGVIFIPESGVAPEAYAPIARNMSGRGYYTFVLTNTNGKPTADVISDVYQAVATRTNLTAWALFGHGRGGDIASKVIADDNNKKFNALTMVGAASVSDLRKINVQTIYVYGALDTVVTPAQALDVISTRLPRDALVIRMPNAAHMDFAFTSCVGNSFVIGRGGCGNFRLSNTLASLTLPAAGSGNKVVVNPENPIVQTNGANGVLLASSRSCRPQSTEYYDDATNTWIAFSPEGDEIVDLLYVVGGGDDDGLRVEARTNRNAYGALRTFLEGKRLRATVSCRNLDDQCVEFTVGSAPELSSAALSIYTSTFPLAVAPTSNLYAFISQSLTAMVGRAATERALSFFDNAVLFPVGAQNNSKPYPQNYYAPVEAQIIDVPSTDPNVPLDTQWYVFRPKAPAVPLGGYVYYPGGAVQSQAYAALAFEIAARGYVVVIPTAPLRISTLNVAVFQAIYSSPLFADVNSTKWAVGGHSLGGIAACQAVIAYSSQIKALAMHAGGLITSFVNRTQRVIQIYGSLDGLSPGGSERFRTPFLGFASPLTQFVAIQGGVHYGFADYGYQFPDNVATISIQDQQSQAAQLVANTLALAFQ